MSADLYVPVVWDTGETTAIPTVLFCRVVSDSVRPERAYRSDVEDVGKLCMAVEAGLSAERGEWPDEAYVLASTEPAARTKPLQGRSCALAMALASLGCYYHLPLPRTVVATGDLNVSGTVLPVKDLLTKLQACARGSLSGDLILFPASQLPSGTAVDRLPAEDYGELAHQLPGLTPVSTLAQAANLVLQRDDFGESPAARLRNTIEHLRYDRSRAGELYQRSRELFELAQALPDERGLGPILRYHALMTGEFALRALVRDGTALLPWPDTAADSNLDLQRKLAAKAEETFERHQAWLPAELRAEHANFHAVRGFQTLDFLGSIHLADQALSLPKLVQGQHSERRKLQGTRAQFRCRQGLRSLAVGLNRDADYWLMGAVADAREALDHAPKGPGTSETNDAARVRVYVCQALLALRCLRQWLPKEQAEFDQQAHLVLGQILDASNQAQPTQAPGWMLDAVLQRHLLEGDWAGVLAQWDRAALVDYTLPGMDAAKTQRMAALLDPQHPALPCDFSVLQTLLAATVEVGAADRARTFAGRLASLHAEPTLTALVRLWPATLAPADWALPIPNWLVRWQAGEEVNLQLPPGLEAEPFLADQLQALRRPGESRHAQRRLQLWLGVPA